MKILTLKGLKDKNLSEETRMLFKFLVHCAWHPNAYDLNVVSVAQHMDTDVLKVRASLDELQMAGYLSLTDIS